MKNNNNLFLWLLLVVVIGGAVLIITQTNNRKNIIIDVEPTPVPTQTATPTTDPKINFIKIGNWSEGYLVYEEPGKPALRAKVKFDDKSRCDEEVCIASDYKNGDRLAVKAIKTGGEILIRTMTKIGE